MVRRQSIRNWQTSRSRYAVVWVAYLLLCGSMVLAGAMLRVTGFALSPGDLLSGHPPSFEIPVARIQLIPDRNNLCRALLFHNDSGRYQDGGMGQCTVPKDMLVWSVQSRAEAFADAFRSSWKGDTVASSSR
jgi:hypothetical protein